MTDDADSSDAKIEAAILEGIRRVREGKALPWTGECHYCEDAVPEPLRFCDADCRDDYERIEHSRRLRGR